MFGLGWKVSIIFAIAGAGTWVWMDYKLILEKLGLNLTALDNLKPKKHSTIHSTVVLLLTLVCVSSCSLFQGPQPLPQKVKVYTVPVISEPIIPAKILGPSLKLPETIVISQKEVTYYNEACAAFIDIGKPDRDSEEEVLAEYKGLTRSSACDWAIYGFTEQGWVNLESQISEISTYTKSLRARIELLEGMINDQYEASLRQREAFEAINKEN